MPSLLVGNPALPAQDLAALIALAKAKPDGDRQVAAQAPRRLRSLEEAGDRLFTFSRLPPSQWRSARTTNAIERLQEEFKRRIKTQTVLPSAARCAIGPAGPVADQRYVRR